MFWFQISMNALLFQAFVRIFVKTFLVPSAVGVLWVIIFLQITRHVTVCCFCCVISYTTYPCCSKIRHLLFLASARGSLFGSEFNSSWLHKKELKQSRPRRLWKPLKVISHALLVRSFWYMMAFSANQRREKTWRTWTLVDKCSIFSCYLQTTDANYILRG